MLFLVYFSPRVIRHNLNQEIGAWCGLSAAFLWVAEGTAITSFASEDKKGMYVSIFWSIFQSGVVIGAAIPVGQNWNTGSSNGSHVNDGTYVGLFILMLLGAFLGLVRGSMTLSIALSRIAPKRLLTPYFPRLFTHGRRWYAKMELGSLSRKLNPFPRSSGRVGLSSKGTLG